MAELFPFTITNIKCLKPSAYGKRRWFRCDTCGQVHYSDQYSQPSSFVAKQSLCSPPHGEWGSQYFAIPDREGMTQYWMQEFGEEK